MVQVTFDTNNDSLEELQHALQLLEKTVMKRCEQMARSNGAQSAATPPQRTATQKDIIDDKDNNDKTEETALDTPFLKITVKSENETVAKTTAEPKTTANGPIPTLNELLSESITEDELHRMFKESSTIDDAPAEKHATHHARAESENEEIIEEKPFIEIIEYGQEEK